MTAVVNFFTRALTFVSVLLGACPFSVAQGSREPVSALALVGTWTTTAPMRDGKFMTTRVTLTQSLKFYGSATVDGATVWTFSGRWALQPGREGAVLTWNYEQSVPELAAESTADRDDVISVSAKKLTLRSRRDGREQVFSRVN
jgi:hypothetical protein